MRGEKTICLAITEPYAGSDVAGLRTEAKMTADGKYYILNGEKKWITNGVFSDFFTVAVRTGGPGMGGISLLLVERTMPGVTTRQMKCTGVWPSGTTYIAFEDVKVPVENLIGKENEGFKYIMSNFNHEVRVHVESTIASNTLLILVTNSVGASSCTPLDSHASALRSRSRTLTSARPLASD